MGVRTTVKITAAALAVIIAALLLWATAGVLLLLFAGVLLAVLLNGSSKALSDRTGMPYSIALAALLVTIAAAAAGLVWFVVPRVAEQITELRESLPQAVERVQDYLRGIGVTKDIWSELPAAGSYFTGVFSSTVGAIGAVVLVLFMGIFLAAQPRTYLDGFLQLLPANQRLKSERLAGELGDTIWWWLLAQFGSMTVVGVLTWIGLYFLDVPLSFTLALLAMLLTFIPNVGPVIAAIPAMLLALLNGPTSALWVGGLYIAVQTVESYLITPLFQQRAVKLPPALLIASQVMMSVLAGIPGLVVATPLTAVIVVLVRRLYVDEPKPSPVPPARQEPVAARIER